MAKLRTPLSDAEIRSAYAAEGDQTAPAIISPVQLATILGKSHKTIYFWLAEGRLEGAARRRGKHWLIWRDRAIALLFNSPDWN